MESTRGGETPGPRSRARAKTQLPPRPQQTPGDRSSGAGTALRVASRKASNQAFIPPGPVNAAGLLLGRGCDLSLWLRRRPIGDSHLAGPPALSAGERRASVLKGSLGSATTLHVTGPNHLGAEARHCFLRNSRPADPPRLN